MSKKLVDTVTTFLDRATEDYARIQGDRFSQNMFCELIDGKSNSPIEQLFYIAANLMCSAWYEEVNPEAVFDKNGAACLGPGVHIIAQKEIGKYRVDFVLMRAGVEYQPVVVELDGHEFHDKDKRQRAYEKGRDRFLVKRGYKVLHFTGSEVVADPYKVAHEALELLGVFPDGQEYSKENPFGF